MNNAASGIDVSSDGSLVAYVGGVTQGVQSEYVAEHEEGFTKGLTSSASTMRVNSSVQGKDLVSFKVRFIVGVKDDNAVIAGWRDVGTSLCYILRTANGVRVIIGASGGWHEFTDLDAGDEVELELFVNGDFYREGKYIGNTVDINQTITETNLVRVMNASPNAGNYSDCILLPGWVIGVDVDLFDPSNQEGSPLEFHYVGYNGELSNPANGFHNLGNYLLSTAVTEGGD
jgi:hypothetical protein